MLSLNGTTGNKESILIWMNFTDNMLSGTKWPSREKVSPDSSIKKSACVKITCILCFPERASHCTGIQWKISTTATTYEKSERNRLVHKGAPQPASNTGDKPPNTSFFCFCRKSRQGWISTQHEILILWSSMLTGTRSVW